VDIAQLLRSQFQYTEWFFYRTSRLQSKISGKMLTDAKRQSIKNNDPIVKEGRESGVNMTVDSPNPKSKHPNPD
jgi:hypothetical protein